MGGPGPIGFVGFEVAVAEPSGPVAVISARSLEPSSALVIW